MLFLPVSGQLRQQQVGSGCLEVSDVDFLYILGRIRDSHSFKIGFTKLKAVRPYWFRQLTAELTVSIETEEKDHYRQGKP